MFIIFDLDGTLFDVKTNKLIAGVTETLYACKQAGHYMAVCSNNVLAKSILFKLNVLNLFDFVVAHSSSTRKAVEFLECWEHYRYLHRKKLIAHKMHLNRMIFIDDDDENIAEIQEMYSAIQLLHSVLELSSALGSLRKGSVTQTIENVRRNIRYTYGVSQLDQLLEVAKDGTKIVYISYLARYEQRRYGGTTNMRYHYLSNCGAIQKCHSVVAVSQAECVKFGHLSCKICGYNVQAVETAKYCF